jgi:hypothetical protein
MSNLRKSMGYHEYSDFLSTPIYDDEGNELWYCSYHEDFEPRKSFYANKSTPRGFQTYCKEAQKKYNISGQYNISKSNMPDKQHAIELLKILGYDMNSDMSVHQQFMERHKKNISN